ncbi:SymE family type I addiction module toxin [Marinobacter sp.]|uniref:SymE family type I addiction module toxin n=1 Tax=Marinobacter sp. TaxID=50741 RepID=UPI0034A277C1
MPGGGCAAVRPVPWILPQSQWLDMAGFAVGTPFKVRVIKRCLVITLNGSAFQRF